MELKSKCSTVTEVPTYIFNMIGTNSCVLIYQYLNLEFDVKEYCHRQSGTGYAYQTVWIHLEDTRKSGIRHRDVIAVINERDLVLGSAFITERMIHKRSELF